MVPRPKGGLGRGLSALIPGAETNGQTAPASEIEIALIQPRPDQPRIRFEPGPLEELVQSIRAQGVIQPLLVTPREGRYLLVAGERRLRAARAAGLFKVPCRVLEELDDRQILEISLVENLQREDLNPIELAEGYQRLVHDLGLSQQEVAERVGKDRATVANTLRLLKLPPPVVEMVLDGKLSSGHARALLAVEGEGERLALARRTLEEGLSVRELEREARRKKQRHSPKAESVPDTHARETARQLEEAVGMPVEIRHRGPGGRVTIRYASIDELDRLILLLRRETPQS